VKEANALIKVATVVSSVLLLSGFVSYRAGAFNWLMGNSAPLADSGSSPTLQQPPATAEQAPTLMPGSKSMIGHDLIVGLQPAAQPAAPSQQATPAPAAPAPTVIMSGSKSVIVFEATTLGDNAGRNYSLGLTGQNDLPILSEIPYIDRLFKNVGYGAPLPKEQSTPPPAPPKTQVAPPPPPPKTEVAPPPAPTQPAVGTIEQKPAIMSGTKSEEIFRPSDFPPPQ
jgi:hypothetical protein